MQVLMFEGTPTQMGQAFGEQCREQIAELYDLRMRNAIEQAASYGGRIVHEGLLIEVARRCLPIVQAYHPDGFEELAGIALGADLSLEKIWAMNALTDLRDMVGFGDLAAMKGEGEGCSSFIVQEDLTNPGPPLCGQTWDLAPDNMPYIRVVLRKPEHGPATTCLTLVGCLSLIGMNDAGIAIGTTNVRTTDSGLGVGYLDIIHKALSAPDLATAAGAITEAPRAGAHYYFLLDSQGKGRAIECTAKRHVELEVRRGHYVHCNHLLFGSNQEVEVTTSPVTKPSTRHRHERLSTLIQTAKKPLAVDGMKRFLSDHERGESQCICRHDVDDMSTNGAVIMAPRDGLFWAVHRQPCLGEWVRLEI